VNKTPDEIRANRIGRIHRHFKMLTIGSIFNKHPSGLACMFQRLVRLANADDDGWCQCVTCGEVRQWNELDAGHYVTRFNKATILDERNCWPQCKNCNQWHGGSPALYRVFLVQKFGEEVVLELERTKFPKNHVWNRYELAEKKYDLEQEIKVHEKRLGIKSR